MKKAKKIIIISTKGGSGKSTIANYITPFYFIDGKVQKLTKEKVNLSIVELEATNSSREELYKQSLVNYQNNRMFNLDEVQDFFEEAIFDNEKRIIFDIGGGRDSLNTITAIAKSGYDMSDFVFIFPFNLTKDSFMGAYETWGSLNTKIKDMNSLFVLNKITYGMDDTETPYKEFLDKEDIEKEAKRAGISLQNLYDKNLEVTYIPEFFPLLPKELFQTTGCCLDFCKELIAGQSLADQRKDIIEKAKAFSKDINKQKEFYKTRNKVLIRQSEMFRMLHYSEPFFKAIDTVINRKCNKKVEEK